MRPCQRAQHSTAQLGCDEDSEEEEVEVRPRPTPTSLSAASNCQVPRRRLRPAALSDGSPINVVDSL